MNMEKQYLDESQMNILESLGVNIKDASMSVDVHVPTMHKELIWGYVEDSNNVMFETIPIYTLQDLLKKIPKNIKKGIYNYILTIEYLDGWYVSYIDFSEELIHYKDLNLIDAIYNIFIWCLKNNYVENGNNCN